MNLGVYGYTGNNQARLEYNVSASKPSNAPAYVISNDKADEFVKKYNQINKKTQKVTLGMIIAGILTGSGYSILKKNSKIKLTLNVFLGGFIGGICGSVLAFKLKNNLMDKYNVKNSDEK